jgi:hypothetical protein
MLHTLAPCIHPTNRQQSLFHGYTLHLALHILHITCTDAGVGGIPGYRWVVVLGCRRREERALSWSSRIGADRAGWVVKKSISSDPSTERQQWRERGRKVRWLTFVAAAAAAAATGSDQHQTWTPGSAAHRWGFYFLSDIQPRPKPWQASQPERPAQLYCLMMQKKIEIPNDAIMLRASMMSVNIH